MALTMDTTVGGDAANSYCSVAAADTYHDHHLYGDTWNAAELWRKQAALIWATRLLDEQADWVGTKTYASQRLRWPRSGGTDRDGYAIPNDLIPEGIQQATAELARYLLTEDRTAERGYGILSVQADVVSVTFDKTDQKPILPPSVRSLLTAFGAVPGGPAGWVPLQRA